MRQSNGYIIGFAVVTTVILGGLLSMAAVFLKEPQRKARELDTKSQILNAVITVQKGVDDVNGIYAKRIRSFIVDANGDIVDGGGVAEDVNIRKEFKKESSNRQYPVFRFISESNESETEAYILPVFGNGLWDNIWGYVALNNDFQAIKGVVFDHTGETPGLGARITDKEIQSRYKGKKIFKEEDGQKVVESVTMLKAEKGNDLTDYQVDGMSGATKTAEGVNDMLKKYLQYYKPFFEKTLKSTKVVEKDDPIESDSATTTNDSLFVVTDSLQVESIDSLQSADSIRQKNN